MSTFCPGRVVVGGGVVGGGVVGGGVVDVVLAPLASEPFHDSFVAVTFWPDCDHLANQPDTTFCELFGKAKPRVQALTGSARFLMVTVPVKPPGQSLVG